jgi:DNA-binding MarR family transcriptional regulator
MNAVAIREKHDGALDSRASVRLWLRLLSCTMAIETIVQRRLTEQFGTTLARFDVLAALERHPEGMTMSALSRSLLMSNGNATQLVQKLAKDGLVAMAPSPTDGRSSIVSLTDKGASDFRALARCHHAWIDGLVSGLPAEERDSLYEALGSLKASIASAAQEENLP